MRTGLGVALVGLVVCVGCGSEPTPDAVVDAIKELGGAVKIDKNGAVVDASFPIKVTDAGLAHLKGLANLTGLDLTGTKVTDAGLEHLKGLTNLRVLGLLNTQTGDSGLVHLKNLANLRLLTLGTKVTDAGLVHLMGMTKLEELYFSSPKVTGAGLKTLQKFLPGCLIRNY